MSANGPWFPCEPSVSNRQTWLPWIPCQEPTWTCSTAWLDIHLGCQPHSRLVSLRPGTSSRPSERSYSNSLALNLTWLSQTPLRYVSYHLRSFSPHQFYIVNCLVGLANVNTICLIHSERHDLPSTNLQPTEASTISILISQRRCKFGSTCSTRQILYDRGGYTGRIRHCTRCHWFRLCWLIKKSNRCRWRS